MKWPRGYTKPPPDCMKAEPTLDLRGRGGLAGYGAGSRETTATGELRACSPAETYLKIQPHLAQLGITRVASQTGLDRLGIPVWCAVAPNAKAIVIAQGKGLDDQHARISAAMEAVERVVATEPGCQVRRATAADHEMGQKRFHSLDGLIARNQVPLGKTEPIDWVGADDLLTGDTVSLPFDAVDFDRTRRFPRYWQSSDGLASGNTRDEAILHGLLERVERDALALWSVTSTDRRFSRRIDPRTLASDAAAELLDKVDRAGLQLSLFDITTDLGIPCVAALLAPETLHGSIRYVDLTLGAGAALQPEAAIIRAVLEAAQSRMTYIAGARDDLMPGVFERRAEPAHLKAFLAAPAVRIDEMPVLHATCTTEALSVTTNKLAGRGIDQLFAVDLGHRWLPVSVFKVLAPQLENPDGARRLRFGSRSLSRSLQ